MKETGFTIAEWAEQTFGPVRDGDASVLKRAEKEWDELCKLVLLSTLDRRAEDADRIATECADVVICLARLASRQGFDLFEVVDRKMRVNRARKWTVDGEGHGQHAA